MSTEPKKKVLVTTLASTKQAPKKALAELSHQTTKYSKEKNQERWPSEEA